MMLFSIRHRTNSDSIIALFTDLEVARSTLWRLRDKCWSRNVATQIRCHDDAFTYRDEGPDGATASFYISKEPVYESQEEYLDSEPVIFW